MSKLIAVDIVLLPPLEIIEKICSSVDYLAESSVKLNNRDCLPHVSLAMGLIDETEINVARETLHHLALSHRAINLTLSRSADVDTPDGKHFSEIVVGSERSLVNLHLGAMDSFRNVLTHDDVQTSMFVSPPKVADISTYWVTHYYDKKGSDDFHPHITIGQGKVKNLLMPFTFETDRLALCRLGTYCTCRKILAEFKLR